MILLDEIGRGTSTYDGISIAWAISEYLHEHPSKAKVLFATHYHEINEMAATFARIKNFTVSVKELKDDVLFLRKLVPGRVSPFFWNSCGKNGRNASGGFTPGQYNFKKIRENAFF